MYFTHELTYVKLLLRLRLFIIVSRRGLDESYKWSVSSRGTLARRCSLASRVVSNHGNEAQLVSTHTSIAFTRSAITTFPVTIPTFLRSIARARILDCVREAHYQRYCAVSLSFIRCKTRIEYAIALIARSPNASPTITISCPSVHCPFHRFHDNGVNLLFGCSAFQNTLITTVEINAF